MLFRCCCVVLLVTHMTSLSLLLTYCVMIVGDCCGSQGETTFKTDAHLMMRMKEGKRRTEQKARKKIKKEKDILQAW